MFFDCCLSKQKRGAYLNRKSSSIRATSKKHYLNLYGKVAFV